MTGLSEWPHYEHYCRPCEVRWRGTRQDGCWLCDRPSTVAVPIVPVMSDDLLTYNSSGTVCPEDLWREPDERTVTFRLVGR